MPEPFIMQREECLDLLAKGVVGRVAVCTPDRPHIIPVNYSMHEDTIVFRTTPYSILGTYAWNTDVAFEIDHIDYNKHVGWSVVAVGRAHMVDDDQELRAIRAGWDPTPWAGGIRWFYIRMRYRDVTGRRIDAI